MEDHEMPVDDVLRPRPLGRTSLTVTGVGVGGSPLGGGGMAGVYGHDTSYDAGGATARAGSGPGGAFRTASCSPPRSLRIPRPASTTGPECAGHSRRASNASA